MSTRMPPEEGIGNYVSNLSKKLTGQGHEVIVVTRGGFKPEVKRFNGLLVYRLPFVMAYPFHVGIHGIFVRSLFDALSGSLDVIHVHSPLPPSISSDVPIVTTFHTPQLTDSMLTEDKDIHQVLHKLLGFLAYRNEMSQISCSQVVTTVSKGVASELTRYYGVNNKEMILLGNAASDVFLEAGRNASQLRDEETILFIGSLESRKGLLELVESMKFVVKSVPKARLVIIGKGPLLSKVLSRVRALGLERNVELRGFISRKETIDWCLRASVFALPSHYEGLPTALLEAMACRLPIVATAVRGNVEIVEHEVTGLLVPPKAPKHLAEAITCLLEDSDLRNKFGKNGRRLVEAHFTWDRVTERAMAAYRSAISKKNSHRDK